MEDWDGHMRTPGLMVAAALTLGQGMAAAQGAWGSVKSWSGTVTIEATDKRLNYKATGDFTISDDVLPDGSHVMWPMPASAASEHWRARVVASYEAKTVSESGDPIVVSCKADNQKASRVGVTIDPRAPKYVFSVSAPEAIYKCSGNGPKPNSRLPQTDFQVTGPRGAPGQVSGTEVFTVGMTTIKVSFTMAPSRK